MTLYDKYTDLKKEYNSGKLMSFITELTKDNSMDTLNFHYNLLKDKSNQNIFNSVRNSFKKRRSIGINFLKSKIKIEENEDLKSEAFFILGSMKCYDIKGDVISLLQATNKLETKYKCIIVLGWLGENVEDINYLSHIMEDFHQYIDLRAYAASATRQIWFRNNTWTTYILKKYRTILTNDNEYILDSTIIACAQDILKKKWGIIESRIGEISGDVPTAKLKALKAIDNYLKGIQ